MCNKHYATILIECILFINNIFMGYITHNMCRVFQTSHMKLFCFIWNHNISYEKFIISWPFLDRCFKKHVQTSMIYIYICTLYRYCQKILYCLCQKIYTALWQCSTVTSTLTQLVFTRLVVVGIRLISYIIIMN